MTPKQDGGRADPGGELEEAFLELFQSMRARFRREAESVGLTMPKAFLLRHVVERGEVAPGEVAREAGVTPAAITFLVQDLVSDGYLKRTRSATDSRRAVLTATAAGRTLSGQLNRKARWITRLVEQELGPEDLEAFVRTLRHLTSAVSETVEREERRPRSAAARTAGASSRYRRSPPAKSSMHRGPSTE